MYVIDRPERYPTMVVAKRIDRVVAVYHWISLQRPMAYAPHRLEGYERDPVATLAFISG